MRVLTEHGIYIIPHFTLTVQDGRLVIDTHNYKDWKFYPFPEDGETLAPKDIHANGFEDWDEITGHGV